MICGKPKLLLLVFRPNGEKCKTKPKCRSLGTVGSANVHDSKSHCACRDAGLNPDLSPVLSP